MAPSGLKQRRRNRLRETGIPKDDSDKDQQLDDKRSTAIANYQLALIATLSLVIYVNSLSNGFVYDDARGVVANPDVEPDAPWLDLIYHDFWGTPMDSPKSHKSYRPLTVLTFKLNAFINGKDPFGFHVVNVLLHVLVSVQFSCVASALTKSSSMGAVAGLLFATHSIHTEAVANTVGRAEILSAVFFLLSFHSYTKAAKGISTAWPSFIMACLYAAASMLCKEQGITVLGFCLAWDALNHTVVSPVTLVRNMLSRVPEVQGLTRRFLGVIGVGILLVYLRTIIMFGQRPRFNPLELKAAFADSFLTRALTFNYLIAFNIKLLLWPLTLCSDWSYGSIPLVESFADPRLLMVVATYGALFYLIRVVLSWKVPEESRTIGLGLALLAIPFLPSMNLFFYVGFVVAERVLYIPSMGICILAAFVWQWVASKISYKVANTMGVIVLLLMSIRTVTRNKDWHSDESIHAAGMLANPLNVKLIANYGHILHEKVNNVADLEEKRRLVQKTEEVLQTAMKLDPNYSATGFSYGNLLQEMGRYDEAIVAYKQSLAHADYTKVPLKAMNNLATVCFKVKDYEGSEQYFKAALDIEPTHINSLNGIGSLYGTQKRYKEAESSFLAALEVKPDYVEARFNLGTLYVTMDRLTDAERELKVALQLQPNHSGALNNLKVVEFQKSKKGA